MPLLTASKIRMITEATLGSLLRSPTFTAMAQALTLDVHLLSQSLCCLSKVVKLLLQLYASPGEQGQSLNGILALTQGLLPLSLFLLNAPFSMPLPQVPVVRSSLLCDTLFFLPRLHHFHRSCHISQVTMD